MDELMKNFMERHKLNIGDSFALSHDFDCKHNQAVFLIQNDGTLHKLFSNIMTPIHDESVIVAGDGLSGLWLIEKRGVA